MTALERAEATARLKEIYEALHPEAKHGHAEGSRRYKNPQKPREKEGVLEDLNFRSSTNAAANGSQVEASFVSEVASKTGRSRAAVSRDARIGSKLAEEAKEVVRGTPIEDHQGKRYQIRKGPKTCRFSRRRQFVFFWEWNAIPI